MPATKRARLKETLIEAALAANGAMDDAGDGDDDGEEGEEVYDSDEEDARAEASAAVSELFALSRAARSEASMSIDASRDDDDVDMDQILALHKRGRSLSETSLGGYDGIGGGGPSSAGASRARDKPAPFLTKLMEILESGTYEGLIKWVAPTDAAAPAGAAAAAAGGSAARSFVISDSHRFSKEVRRHRAPLCRPSSCLAPSGTPHRSPLLNPPLPSPQVLPTFFKHSKLSSFVQQLYTYGFRRCQDSTQYTLAALPTPKIPGAALGDGTPSSSSSTRSSAGARRPTS